MGKNDAIHVRLEGDDKAFVNFISGKQHISKSTFIRQMIRLFRIELESTVVFDQVQGDLRVTVRRQGSEPWVPIEQPKKM